LQEIGGDRHLSLLIHPEVRVTVILPTLFAYSKH